MNCRDFKELSESYLSDELMAETNIQLFRHLENCRDCRIELAERRKLRSSIKAAVLGSPDFQMPRRFGLQLTAQLREMALRDSLWSRLFKTPRILVPVMAALLIAVTSGIIVLRYNSIAEIGTAPSFSITGYLAQASLIAIGNHKDCAIDHLSVWTSGSMPVKEQAAQLAETVAVPLRANYREGIEILHSHDCNFEGHEFSHVILRRDGRVVSVFFDKTEIDRNLTNDETATNSIVCEKQNGLQVASFRSNGKAVFVVSDLTEPENLQIARAISEAFSV